ncbi:fungal pheromone STE3G-protein-coupled receptor [Peniophora sp. CONT]|nr:fungal pheromone STE3G-protein-coupled receptor [Peniophora sp. CONT]
MAHFASSQAWNIGVLLLGGWVMVRTFFRGVEGIVWRNSTKDLAPVWCDISTHLVIGSLFGGQPACSLIITRQLHRVTQLYSPERLTRKEKRRELLLNLLIGVGLPFLIIILYTMVQDCRYIVTEDVGCSPSMDGTILTLCVVHTWAVALPLYSAVRYCPGIIKELWVHSGQMTVVLPVLPEIDRARYMRVLFIACIDIVITLPVGAIVLAEALMQSGQEKLPWFPDWHTLHQHWDPIVELATDWQSSTSQRFTIYFAQTSGMVLGLAFVALFGTSEEGIKAYRHAIWATARMFGWRRRVRLEVTAEESTLEFESPEPSPSYHSPM